MDLSQFHSILSSVSNSILKAILNKKRLEGNKPVIMVKNIDSAFETDDGYSFHKYSIECVLRPLLERHDKLVLHVKMRWKCDRSDVLHLQTSFSILKSIIFSLFPLKMPFHFFPIFKTFYQLVKLNTHTSIFIEDCVIFPI